MVLSKFNAIFLAKKFNPCLPYSVLMVRDNSRVSITPLVDGPKPNRSYPVSIKPISNEALCATKMASPTHSLNSVSTSSIYGASTSMSSVMCVRLIIVSDNFSCGLLNLSNLSIISPSLTLTAASSII